MINFNDEFSIMVIQSCSSLRLLIIESKSLLTQFLLFMIIFAANDVVFLTLSCITLMPHSTEYKNKNNLFLGARIHIGFDC